MGSIKISAPKIHNYELKNTVTLFYEILFYTKADNSQLTVRAYERKSDNTAYWEAG